MRDERLVRGFAPALAALILAASALYLLSDAAFAQLMFAFGGLCAAFGLAVGWLLGRRNAALQIACAIVPAAALALLPVWAGGPAYTVYPMMALGAALSLWTERLTVTSAAKPLKAGVAIAPLVTLLIGAFAMLFAADGRQDAAGMITFLIALGIIWFAITAVVMNRLSLRAAARSSAGVSAGVRRAGFAGSVVFILATVLLACVGPIVQFLGDAFRKLAQWAFQLFLLIGSLFPQGEGGQGGAQQNPEDMLPKAEGEQSLLSQIITYVIIGLILLVIVGAIVYGLSKLLPKLWTKLRDRLKGVFSSWHEDEGYRDRTESLLSLRQALTGAGDRFRKFARRFRRRPRIGDFPTNAGRARFLFREYLLGLMERGHEPPPGATANEIARPAPALASAYNLARYAEREPTDRQIEQAAESLKQ